MLLIKRPKERLTVSLKRAKFLILNSFFKPKIVRRIAVFKCFLWVRLWLWHMSSIVNCWCWIAMTLMRVSLCLKCWPFFVHFCRIEFYICVAILSFRERERMGDSDATKGAKFKVWLRVICLKAFLKPCDVQKCDLKRWNNLVQHDEYLFFSSNTVSLHPTTLYPPHPTPPPEVFQKIGLLIQYFAIIFQ